ncbi:MAG: hypothetical protein IK120_07665 [Muribaculaceae bacterium]|nr:hypothetical protein [Muribaculaceae bacterium]
MKENENNTQSPMPPSQEPTMAATTETPAESPATDNAVETPENGTINDTEAENLPTLGEVLRIASLDPRVGHYIIDLLAGTPADDAFKAHFMPPAEAVDTDALIAEAEQRGYLRGRNERISLEMRAPASSPDNDDSQVSDYSSQFLTGSRRNAWSNS